jgi:hypothetical protein
MRPASDLEVRVEVVPPTGAEDNRAHVRQLLAARQPVFAAWLEQAVALLSEQN